MYSYRYGGDYSRSDRRMRLLVNGAVRKHMVSFKPTGLAQAGQEAHFSWVVIAVSLQPGENTIRLEATGQGGPRVDLLYVVPPRPPIVTIAGTPGQPGSFGVTDSPIQSQLHGPLGLALDEPNGFLFVADADNGLVHRLRLTATDTLAPGADEMVTVAGGGDLGNTRAGIPATDSKLFRPVALAVDAEGRYLYVSDAKYNQVRRVDLLLEKMTAVCADQTPKPGEGPWGGAGGPWGGLGDHLMAPHGLALDDPAGLLLIAERGNDRIRAVNVSDNTCLAHYGSVPDVIEGPQGLVLDPRDRTLYASQMKRHRVLKRVLHVGLPD